MYQLTTEHLQQLPRPWPEFMYASRTIRTGSRELAYNVPAHSRMLWERMEENLVYFLVRSFPNTDKALRLANGTSMQTCSLSGGFSTSCRGITSQ